MFISVWDPVKGGLVDSLARPGGNITGFAVIDVSPKRLELFKETFPILSRVALLINPDNVVLSHYDDFFLPYKHGEDPTSPGGMKFVPFANYDDFVTELKNLKVKYNYRYDIYQPKTGQCIRFPVSDPIASSEQ